MTYSRIKRLTRRKIIKQFTIIVDEDKLGFPRRQQALVQIAKLEQVRVIQEGTGRFDAFVTDRGKTIEEVYKIVAEDIGKVPGVNQAETFVGVETLRPDINFKIAN